MSWNDLVYGLGEMIEATFVVLELLGNFPNILFTLVIFVGFIYWLNELVKYRRKAEKSGKIE